MAERAPLRAPFRSSIRLQISLVLLLSALNGIVLVSAAVALLSAILTGPDIGQLNVLQDSVGAITALHADILREGGDDPERVAAQDEALALLVQRLGGVEVMPGGSSTAEAYRDAVTRWRAAERTPQSDARLTSAYYQVMGALEGPLRDGPTRLLNRSLTALTGVTIWVVVVAVTTVIAAFRLRYILSIPLERLRQAAGAVARGKLETPFPDPGSSREIQELAQALDSMRRSLVQAIERQEAHAATIQAMLDALSDGVFFLNAEGVVIEFNPRALELVEATGGEPAAVEGRPLTGALPGLPADFLSGPQHEPLQLNLDNQGRRVHLEVRVSRPALVGSGSIRSWVVALRDVSEAVEAEQIKRDFLSVITHELKTPLTVIEGYIRLLLMGKGGDLSPKQAQLLERSREQTGLLGRMVQDLLDTTRIEGGNLKLERSPQDLSRCVAEVAEQFAAEAISQRLKLHLEAWEGPPLVAELDSFRIKQVLSNLVRNAMKFTPAGGEVTLSTGLGDGRVWASVADSGRGIPDHAKPHLFKKFYQVEQGDTRKAGGAGLGLYICDQLVRLMEGRIEVESQEGLGSRFIVSFPMGPERD